MDQLDPCFAFLVAASKSQCEGCLFSPTFRWSAHGSRGSITKRQVLTGCLLLTFMRCCHMSLHIATDAPPVPRYLCMHSIPLRKDLRLCELMCFSLVPKEWKLMTVLPSLLLPLFQAGTSS